MTQSSPAPRRGRPRAENAGEVDRRILNAAMTVILDVGYSRASMEQIADLAHASKSTLYSRYPTKATLFAAVVRNSGVSLPEPDRQGTRRERLTSAGLELADATLTPGSIALMRATSAESDIFPDVAREGFTLGFESCARHIAAAAAHADSDIEAQMPFARRFVELALHPLYMHAFFGANLDHLRDRARSCVPEVVDYLTRTTMA